jgi:hypothetical protein
MSGFIFLINLGMKLSNQELALDRFNSAIKKSEQHLEACAEHWQKIVFGKYDKALNLECLFRGLELNYPALNAHATEWISQRFFAEYSANPLGPSSCLTPIGKLREKKTTIKKRLKKEGVNYEAKLSDQTTHILLGYRLNQEELNWLLEHYQDYTLLTEQIFQQFWAETAESYLLQADLLESQWLQLKELLWHKDETNQELGLSMLESGGLPPQLLTSVFLIYKFSENEKMVKRANHLLKVYGSADLLLLLRKLKKDWWSSEYEQWITKAGLNNWEIYQYEYLNKGLKISLFQKAMNESPKEEQIRFLEKAMDAWSWGDELDRMQLPADFDLETHANLVYGCTHLRHLDIQPAYANRLKALPKGITALQQLEELTIYTALKEFPVEIAKLPKLKRLKINMASMRLPEDIFEKGFESLEELELTFYRYKKLPESIAALQNLEVIKVPSGDLEELPAALRQLPKLTELSINNNKLRDMPDVLFLLTNLKKLDISGYWMRWQKEAVQLLQKALPNCAIKS